MAGIAILFRSTLLYRVSGVKCVWNGDAVFPLLPLRLFVNPPLRFPQSSRCSLCLQTVNKCQCILSVKLRHTQGSYVSSCDLQKEQRLWGQSAEFQETRRGKDKRLLGGWLQASKCLQSARQVHQNGSMNMLLEFQASSRVYIFACFQFAQGKRICYGTVRTWGGRANSWDRKFFIAVRLPHLCGQKRPTSFLLLAQYVKDGLLLTKQRVFNSGHI